MTLRIVPVDRDTALGFIARLHRHNLPPLGYRFALGVAADERLVGVATVGRPVARGLQDGWTVEVTRTCTEDPDVVPQATHACSALYGACWRTARALGYTRAVTYTQGSESGVSPRAAGWLRVVDLPARPGWDTPGRRRADIGTADVARVRWEIRTHDHDPRRAVRVPADDETDTPTLLDLLATASPERAA